VELYLHSHARLHTFIKGVILQCTNCDACQRPASAQKARLQRPSECDGGRHSRRVRRVVCRSANTHTLRVTRRMFALQIGSLCPHLAMLSGQMLICLTLPVQLTNVRLRHTRNNASRWLAPARESFPRNRRAAVSCTPVG
jgi:hypothetical protein